MEPVAEHLPEQFRTQMLAQFLVCGEFGGKETESPQPVNDRLEAQSGTGIGESSGSRRCTGSAFQAEEEAK